MKSRLMKTVISLAAAITMLSGVFICSAAVVTDGTDFYNLGDANKDNRIDMRDLIRIKKNLATGCDLLKVAAEIDASDLTAVKKYLIGIEDALEPDSSLWNTEIR